VLRTPIPSATLSDVKKAMSIAILLGWLGASLAPGASAQGLPGGRRSDPIDRATGLANRPYTPPPAAPSAGVQDRYVPPQRVYSPSLGREVVVPPHYAGRPGSPPPVVTNPDGQQPTLLPPGSLPPVDRGSAP
jgi:hypothetical protein